MLFVILGMLMLGLGFAGVEPVASWPWWSSAVPFAAALVWWAVVDHFGLTQRWVVRRQDARRAKRRRNAIEAMGLAAFETRRPSAVRHAPRRGVAAQAFSDTVTSVVDTLAGVAEPPASRRTG